MRYTLKTLLFIWSIGIYSCHSDTKKETKDTNVITKQQPKSIEKTQSTEDIDRDTLTQPLMSKIIFPGFSVKVNNTVFDGYRDDNNKFIYTGDTVTSKANVENYRMWTLTTPQDSVQLSIDDDNGLNIGSLEIIPSNKTDRFEVSISFKLQIVADNQKGGILWETMAPYRKIKDSLNYFFSIPKHNDMYSEMGLKMKEVKKKFNLKDTTFKRGSANEEYGVYTETGVIFKNQLCEFPYTPVIYLKIDRFNQNKLVDTRYLVVDFNIPD